MAPVDAVIYPDELIALLRARRVIPFIGAGFSTALDLPDWDSLLQNIAADLEDDIPFDEVKRYCNNDYLQIAEYYLLKCDGTIGPIRHVVSRCLQNVKSPLQSGAHVELLNLGAPQIYTTNYDDLIEATFRILHQPVEVVALPKHLATAQGAKTQVVKYHGDLRHDQTLVLTESSYYARLDFESPMDLKFRSDLLGRSVLFIGYSFRDINIRIIWFKLMRMMKDIRPEDRPTSFILRFDPNPVLQKLYEAVGIKTIVIDPSGKAISAEAKSDLLSNFMLNLSHKVSDDGFIPGQTGRQFLSRALFNSLSKALDEFEKVGRSKGSPRSPRSTELDQRLRVAGLRRIAPEFAQEAANTFYRAIKIQGASALFLIPAGIQYLEDFGPIAFMTLAAIKALTRVHSRDAILSESSLPWDKIWLGAISTADADNVIDLANRELEEQPNYPFADYDIAYLADIVTRMAAGALVYPASAEIAQKAKDFLAEAAKVYSAIADYTPPKDTAPDVQAILAQIDSAAAEREPSVEEDDIPF